MTDQELLELAAKAAGIEIQNAAFSNGPHLVGTLTRWNPLADDGDALRLAIELRLDVLMKDHYTYVLNVPGGLVQAVEKHGKDSHAATRRAIVTAAAQIGVWKE